MNRLAYINYLFMFCLIGAAIPLIVAVQGLQHDVALLKHHSCGFIFWEDGSVSFEDDDTIRYACLKSNPHPVGMSTSLGYLRPILVISYMGV